MDRVRSYANHRLQADPDKDGGGSPGTRHSFNFFTHSYSCNPQFLLENSRS